MKSVADKFGMKIKTKKVGKNQFRITVKVRASSTFYLWAIGSAGKIIIEDLEAVLTAYKEMLQKAMDSMK